MPAATRLRVDFRWQVSDHYFEAHGVLRLVRSQGKKAGRLSTRRFSGEFLPGGKGDDPDSPSPSSLGAMIGGNGGGTGGGAGGGTNVGDLIAMTSPVKCSVGARSGDTGDLDHLQGVLGRRFFSVRHTDLSTPDGAGGRTSIGHLAHSEHVRVEGSTFHVRQIIEGEVGLGSHVRRIGTIDEQGQPWNGTGLRADGRFSLTLENDPDVFVSFTQIYEPDGPPPARQRRGGPRPSDRRRPWQLRVDVTRFEPRVQGIVYETKSRFEFLPARRTSD